MDRQCKGVSITTGNRCKRKLSSKNNSNLPYCHHHKNQNDVNSDKEESPSIENLLPIAESPMLDQTADELLETSFMDDVIKSLSVLNIEGYLHIYNGFSGKNPEKTTTYQ